MGKSNKRWRRWAWRKGKKGSRIRHATTERWSAGAEPVVAVGETCKLLPFFPLLVVHIALPSGVVICIHYLDESPVLPLQLQGGIPVVPVLFDSYHIVIDRCPIIATFLASRLYTTMVYALWGLELWVTCIVVVVEHRRVHDSTMIM